MPAGLLTPDPRLRELSDLGVVLPGALLHTYVSGTPSTPLATTSDAAGLVPNLNPLVASAGGLFGPIYLTPGVAYKFVLTDASGVGIWTQDPVGLGGVAQGGTGLTAGISGGIPYFSSLSAMASSALLAAHGVVLGGGAGAAPLTIGAGSAGQPLRSGGASADPAFGEITQVTALTGTQNDFALTPGCTVLRCNNATPLIITGFSGGYFGQRLSIIPVAAGQVDVVYNSGGSLAANRIIPFITAGNTSMAGNIQAAIDVVYDTSARWMMLGHEQGAPITFTPTLTFGGASVGQTYSSQVGYFYVKGKVLHLWGRLTFTAKGSSVGGAAIAGLPYTSTALGAAFGLIAVPFYTGLATITPPLVGYVSPTTAVVSLQMGGAASSAALTDANFTNASDVVFVGAYPLG